MSLKCYIQMQGFMYFVLGNSVFLFCKCNNQILNRILNQIFVHQYKTNTHQNIQMHSNLSSYLKNQQTIKNVRTKTHKNIHIHTQSNIDYNKHTYKNIDTKKKYTKKLHTHIHTRRHTSIQTKTKTHIKAHKNKPSHINTKT